MTILAWDRSNKYKIKSEVLSSENGSACIVRFGVPAMYGAGIRSLMPFSMFQLRIAVWLFSNRKTFDIIHACDFDTAFTSLILSKFTKKLLVFDIFDYLSTNPKNVLGKVVRFLENTIINKADGVIICTEQRKEQIAGTQPKRLAIIHNSPRSVDAVTNPPKDNSEKQRKTKIAYVGILQDHRLLLEMAEAVSIMDNVELHIGGFGKYEGHFKKMSSDYNNIIYYGRMSYDETIKLEISCDILTAIYDPTIGNHVYAAPNKFYEAMMLGKPLIMVKNTGLSEIVQNNNVGVLINYSKQGFIDGLIELIEQKDNWVEMGETSQNIYKNTFSWDEMKSRLKVFYNSIYH